MYVHLALFIFQQILTCIFLDLFFKICKFTCTLHFSCVNDSLSMCCRWYVIMFRMSALTINIIMLVYYNEFTYYVFLNLLVVFPFAFKFTYFLECAIFC